MNEGLIELDWLLTAISTVSPVAHPTSLVYDTTLDVQSAHHLSYVMLAATTMDLEERGVSWRDNITDFLIGLVRHVELAYYGQSGVRFCFKHDSGNIILLVDQALKRTYCPRRHEVCPRRGQNLSSKLKFTYRS